MTLLVKKQTKNAGIKQQQNAPAPDVVQILFRSDPDNPQIYTATHECMRGRQNRGEDLGTGQLIRRRTFNAIFAPYFDRRHKS